MADGDLILKLDEETASRLQAAADAAGQSVGDYAARVLSERLNDGLAAVREAFAEYDRTGQSADASEVLTAFVARVANRPN